MKLDPLPPLPRIERPWEYVEPPAPEPRRGPGRVARTLRSLRRSRPRPVAPSLVRPLSRGVMVGLVVAWVVLLVGQHWPSEPSPEPESPAFEGWVSGDWWQGWLRAEDGGAISCNRDGNHVVCDQYNHYQVVRGE